MDRKLSAAFLILLTVAALLLCGFQRGQQVILSPAPNAGATIALVQQVFGDATNEAATCGGTGTTCLVPITTTGGDLLTFSSVTNNNVTIQSTNQGGTLVQCPGNDCEQFASGINAVDQAYVLSDTGVTNITVTFDSTHGHAAVLAQEFSCTGGSSTWTKDAVVSTKVTSSLTSPYTGESITISDANDAIIQIATTGNDITTIASPWGHLEQTPADGSGTGGAGIGDHLSTNSGSAPTWTDSGASSATGIFSTMAFYCH